MIPDWGILGYRVIMRSSVPVIDLTPWFSGDETARAAVAAQVDQALQSVGFFLVTGHGVPGEQRSQVRQQARAFFESPQLIESRERAGVEAPRFLYLHELEAGTL